MNNITRADKLLDKIQARTGMSDAGRAWLIAALDPMHDTRLECCGYPDRETNPSVVQVVKQSIALTKPAAFDASHNWGFHAYLDDYLTNDTAVGDSEGHIFTQSNTIWYDQTSSQVPDRNLSTGGLNIVFFDQTTNGTQEISIWPTTPTGSNNRATSLQVDPQFLSGKVRVISQGMEVVNTSTDLYKGGALAVYEQPGSKMDPQCFYETRATGAPLDKSKRHSSGGPGTVAITIGVRSRTFDVLPPRSLAEALILPGTKQWDAKEGCYAVQMMNDMENPPSFGTTVGTLYTENENNYPLDGALSTTNGTTSVFVTPPYDSQDPYGTGAHLIGMVNVKIPFNRKGIIVTGQVPQATFTMNYNTILERIISSQDSVLATLATPSPPEDYIATQLYSEISQVLPLGVAFSKNDLGEWFLGCIDEVANVVSSIGKPIMGAVNGYQEVRRGGPSVAAQGATYNAPQIMPTRQTGGKIKKKKNGQKVIVEGPRMQTGSFNTAASKQATKAKKRVRKGKGPKQPK